MIPCNPPPRRTARFGQVSALLAGLVAGLTQGSAADVAIPPEAALPLSSALTPGFSVRTVIAPDGSVLDNSYLRALRQVNGTLTDATGQLVSNVAVPGSNPDGSYNVDLLDLGTDPVLTTGRFPNDLPLFEGDLPWPGIPDADNTIDPPFKGGPTKMFATEVISYLKLSAGSYTMGMTAGFQRTDVNDDNGWRLFAGANPRSYFATPVAEFQRTGAGFPSGPQVRAGNTNEFTFTVSKDGVYPFRLVQWQTGGPNPTTLEWYVVNNPGTDFEERALLNDPNYGAPVAYNTVNVPDPGTAFVAEVGPQPGSSGVPSAAPITAVLQDGVSAVDAASVKMTLNGQAVVPQSVTRSGKSVYVRYTPNATRSTVDNAVVLTFKDAAGASYSSNWKFSITVNGAPRTVVRGQWDFDSGSLAATVGADLQYLDGVGGVAQAATSFGTTADFGISDINGTPARVMKVTGDLNTKIGYKMYHGIAPNGGGTRVNQYTLIMDVYVHPVRGGAASLLQTSSLDNTDDGDLFWQGSNFGQGGGGYNGTGQFTPNAWHRIVAAYDEAAGVVTKYVDGIKQDDWTANQGLDNPRRALQQYAILFADGDNDERAEMYVNSVQIREGKLSDAEMVLLGGPDAGGIPSDIDAVSVAGQWDFDAGNLAATVGKPLEYLDGANGVAQGATAFGTTTSFGIPDINGQVANVMQVSGDLNTKIGYKMFHGIAPNGGGTLVNQYTIIFDIYVVPVRGGAASLLQISSLGNTDDGDLFWQGSNFGQGGGGYNGTGAFTPNAWHRVAAAYDEAAGVVTKYVDGIKQDDWTANQGLDNPRRALQQYAILFADGDNDERAQMYVNSVQIRAGKLSDAQLALLGGPSASGIPLVLPASTVTGQWDFNTGTLAATIGKPLEYLDGDTADGIAKAATTFGSTTTLGVDDIDGEPANVLQVTGDLNTKIGYKMFHGIAPNGGGIRVNEYTLIMDVLVHPVRGGAASLLQSSSLGNTDDGDLFWQGNNFGQGGGGYNGTGAFTPNVWHRVAISYDEGAKVPHALKYVDGIYQDDWTANQGLDAPRRTLDTYAILFADGDNDERAQITANSIQIRSGTMSKADLAALGKPTAAGIPIALPPSVKAIRHGDLVTFQVPAWAIGYAVETATSLTSGDWQPVGTVAALTYSLPAQDAQRFFRLRKP